MDKVITVLLFIFIGGVKSAFVQLIKYKFMLEQKEKNQPSLHSRPSDLLF